MPYASEAQSRYIHMQAGRGVAWARKFVADAHGTKVRRRGRQRRQGRGRVHG